jgi:hypothetical protein
MVSKQSLEGNIRSQGGAWERGEIKQRRKISDKGKFVRDSIMYKEKYLFHRPEPSTPRDFSG